MKNKKAVVSVGMGIAVLLATALSVGGLIAILNHFVAAEALGNADFVAKDVSTLITITYSAPENVEIIYETPIGVEGEPQIGSFFLDSNNNLIGISPYSEDEMWAEVLSRTAAGFGIGVGIYVAQKTIKYSARGGRAYYRASKEAGTSFRAVHKLFTNKQVFTGTIRNFRTLSKEARAAKQASVAARKARVLGRETESTIRFFRAIYRKVLGKGAQTATKGTVNAGKGVAGESGCISLNGVPIIGPGLYYACRGLLIFLELAFFYLDFVTVVVPFALGIDQGRDAVKVFENSITWNKFPGDDKDIIVDPPNCEPEVRFEGEVELPVELPEKILWLSTPWLAKYESVKLPISFPTDETIKVSGIEYIEGQECVTSHNHFIGRPLDPTIDDLLFEFDLPFSDFTVSAATLVVGGAGTYCAALGVFAVFQGFACYAGFWALIIQTFYDYPTEWMQFMIEPGIIDKSKIYYMDHPVAIVFSRVYDETTGDSRFKVESI